MLNPEFRRYLWTELSLQKLIAMPVLLGAVFALIGSTGEYFGEGLTLVRAAAAIGFGIAVFLLGARRTAAAVVEEVQGGTWDSQRMSALDAWPMVWGKIVGPSVVSWYVAAISAAAYLFAAAVAGDLGDAVRIVFLMVLAGLIAQATALAASLALLRRRVGTARISVTGCQAIGLAAVLIEDPSNILSPWDFHVFDLPTGAISWYGATYDPFAFAAVIRLMLLAWAVLGAYRLMRAELQHRTFPWAWCAFAVWLAIYAGGFWPLKAANTASGWLSVAFLVVATVVYAAFLLDEKNVVILKALAGTLRAREWIKALALTPSWAVCLLVALLTGAGLAGAIGAHAVTNPFRNLYAPSFIAPPLVLAAMFFMLRDIGFLLYMNVATRSRRPDSSGLVCLVVLYGVGGGLLKQLDLDAALPLVLPYDTGSAILTVASPLVQAAAIWVFLFYRLRRPQRAA